jgi:hypothetical protein
MAKRHDDALYIDSGAVNPVAVTNTLSKHMAELWVETHDMTKVKNDPAIKLMVHQLAFICGMSVNWDVLEYSAVVRACCQEAEQSTLDKLDYAIG